MTRTQQTQLLLGGIALAVAILITALIMLENKREYDKRYPGCWHPLWTDTACEAGVAADRLLRSY